MVQWMRDCLEVENEPYGSKDSNNGGVGPKYHDLKGYNPCTYHRSITESQRVKGLRSKLSPKEIPGPQGTVGMEKRKKSTKPW